MSDNKHTPGPLVSRAGSGDIFAPSGELIATVYPIFHEETVGTQEGNLEFIIRAYNSHDEMLAALKAASETLANWNTHPELNSLANYIDDVRAKATGGAA